jgi:hypothetical protein
LAACTRDNRFNGRLRALLAVAALALPAGATVAARATATGACLTAAADSCGAHFSELAELTPANVSGLMPLVAGTAAITRGEQWLTGLPQRPQRGLQVDTAASVDLRLQRFVEQRVPSELAAQGRVAGKLASAVSYLRDSSRLRAWDVVQQRVLWSVRDALPRASCTLITAGGLVFYGTRDGWLKALDARSGRELWKHKIAGGRLEEASSYRGPDGHQYIAVRTVRGNQQRATGPASAAPQGEREARVVFALAH